MADMDKYYLDHAAEEAHKAELLLRGIIVKHRIDTTGITTSEIAEAAAEAVKEAQELIADYGIYKSTLEMSDYYAKQAGSYNKKEDNND